MAFSASGLTRVGGDSNGSLWMYTSTDALADVNTKVAGTANTSGVSKRCEYGGWPIS